MKKIFYLMLAVVLASSCATGYYAPHNINQFGTQTQVILSEANFRIVRHLEVVIDINNTHLKRADVEKSAYAQLIQRANLTGSQALINVVIEEVRRESGIVVPKITQHVAARGTVIEFIDKNEEPTQTASTQGTDPMVSKATTNTSTKSTNTSYQGSAPRSVQTKQIKKEASTEPSPNKYYLAWLLKTGQLTRDKNEQLELSQKYSLGELIQIMQSHSEDNLQRMMNGYDKSLKKYVNTSY